MIMNTLYEFRGGLRSEFFLGFALFLMCLPLSAQPPENAWEEILWIRATIPNGALSTAGFTPDGKTILAGSLVSGVPAETRLYDRETGLLIWRVPTLNYSSQYNPRADYVAMQEYDDSDEIDKIAVWDVGKRQLVGRVEGEFGSTVLSLTVSDNQRYLAFSGWDSTMYVWDLVEERYVQSWKFDMPMNGLLLSPDGKYLFGLPGMSGPFERAYFWDVETGERLFQLFASFSEYISTAFSPDGQYLAIAGFPNIALYKVPEKEFVRNFRRSDDPFDSYSFHTVAFSPDGKLLVGGGDTFFRQSYLWDAESGELLDSVDSKIDYFSVNSFTLDKDNRSLLVGNSIGILDAWDIPENRLVRKVLPMVATEDRRMTITAFSGSGSYLVSANLDGELFLFNTFSGDTIRTIPHTKRKVWSVNGLDVSPNDSLIAVGGRDSLLTLYHFSSGLPAWVSSNRSTPVWDVGFSPDGSRVAASSDIGIVFFDVLSGDSLAVIAEPDTALFAFSPDGTQLVSVNRTGDVRAYNVSTGEPVREIGTQKSAKEILWSNDGRYIAACGEDGNITIWEATTGTAIRTWQHEEGAVNGVAFTPDGRYLMSGGTDATLRVWDIPQNREAYRYNDFPVSVRTLSITPDGKYIATASEDGSYDYRLIVRHGVSTVLSVDEEPEVANTIAVLEQNVPNPFEGTTTIAFELRESNVVRLVVSNESGKQVAVLYDGPAEIGRHEHVFPVGTLPNGTYFYSLEINGKLLTRKMTIVQ